MLFRKSAASCIQISAKTQKYSRVGSWNTLWVCVYENHVTFQIAPLMCSQQHHTLTRLQILYLIPASAALWWSWWWWWRCRWPCCREYFGCEAGGSAGAHHCVQHISETPAAGSLSRSISPNYTRLSGTKLWMLTIWFDYLFLDSTWTDRQFNRACRHSNWVRRRRRQVGKKSQQFRRPTTPFCQPPLDHCCGCGLAVEKNPSENSMPKSLGRLRSPRPN